MTSRPRAAALGAGALLAAVSAGHAAPSTARPAVVPRPALTGHVLKVSLTFPPDTAYCRARLGRACYQPAQLRRAYDVDPLLAHHLDGRGRTIAIVDSFGSPTIAADLHHFDATFGIPDPPRLRIIHPAGAPPAFDPSNADMVGWAEETTLDVEWAHAIAPGARLLLVDTPVSETEGITGFPEMIRAENYVLEHHMADIISMSFGATEQTFTSPAALLGLRSAFRRADDQNVTLLGASGDYGATDELLSQACCYPMRVTSWPSTDPLVTSVGGTQLDLDAAGNRLAPDRVWNDGEGAGGGGLSSIFERPDFQDHVRSVVGDHRGVPDISMSASTDGAVAFYYSFPNPDASPGGWHLVGGTSEATPLFAGIVAIADQAAGHRLGSLDDRLYALARHHESDTGIVDVSGGDNGLSFCTAACGTPAAVTVTVPGYQAVKGYNLATGLGTVDAAELVDALADS